MELNNEKKRFIENIGLFFETQRLPRLAGRMVGYLLICDPPEQTANEIGGMLEMSKGSVSTMTRLLMQMGMIEKVSPFGTRRDYYRIHPRASEQLLLARQDEFSQLRNLVSQGLAVLDNEDQTSQQRLIEMRAMCQLVVDEVPHLIEQLRKVRQDRTA